MRTKETNEAVRTWVIRVRWARLLVSWVPLERNEFQLGVPESPGERKAAPEGCAGSPRPSRVVWLRDSDLERLMNSSELLSYFMTFSD